MIGATTEYRECATLDTIEPQRNHDHPYKPMDALTVVDQRQRDEHHDQDFGEFQPCFPC